MQKINYINNVNQRIHFNWKSPEEFNIYYSRFSAVQGLSATFALAAVLPIIVKLLKIPTLATVALAQVICNIIQKKHCKKYLNFRFL